jgi:hypothetical protein
MKPLFARLLDEQAALFREIAVKGKDGDTELRFGRPYVAASSIAEQFYCEQKIELQRQLGEVETEVKQRGSEGHEALTSEAVVISHQELFQQIFSDQVTIAQELLVASRYKGLILLGQPDAIIFLQGRALYLFEFKFSHSRIPYYTYHIQANVYGKILEGMGFDITHLKYVIAIVPPSSRNESELFTDIVQAVMENKSEAAELTIRESSVRVCPYNAMNAERDIDRALEYWRNKRDAIPTRNPNKCTRCEYQSSCDLKPYKDTTTS